MVSDPLCVRSCFVSAFDEYVETISGTVHSQA